MTITAATLTLSRSHYVADDTDAGIVAGSVALTGGTAGDPYTLRVIRRGYEAGEFVVYSEGRTFSASPSAFSWRMRDVFRDQWGNYSAPCSRVRDDYRLEVMVGNAVMTSVSFSVAPMSVEEMRGRWCRGLPLSGATYDTSDEDILDIILHSYHQLAYGLTMYPEPIRVVSPLLVSEGLVTNYDQVREAAAYRPAPSRDMWLSISPPVPRVLTVVKLQGWLNKEKTFQFDENWYAINGRSGVLSIVPSNAAVLNLFYYGAGFLVLFSQRNHVPNFFQYELVAGGRSLSVEHSEYIARDAAVELLTQVSQAIVPGGGTGYTLSRDGVSESRTLNPRGPYAAIIDNYLRMNQVDPQTGVGKGLTDLRKRFVGLAMATL